jgi:predicted MPP superfamily phosphohydrolase
VRLLEASGLNVLQDRWEEVAPGVIVAGVDDLTARQQFGEKDGHVKSAITGAPPGAVVLLSHSSWEAQAAANAGAGLMLSGHTHAGQIWPFNYLVQLRYPLLAGRYEIEGMTVIVCRGTGTWGPPMRLWRPSEILRITLRPAD